MHWTTAAVDDGLLEAKQKILFNPFPRTFSKQNIFLLLTVRGLRHHIERHLLVMMIWRACVNLCG
jgi:hypothetical protein